MSKLDTTKTTWDLSPMFASDDDPKMASARQATTEATNKFINRWEKQPTYLTNLDDLKTALDEYEAWQRDYSTAGPEDYYWWLRQQVDQNSAAVRAGVQSAIDFSLENANRIQFFELSLGTIKPELQTKILADDRFAPYRHFLDHLFRAAQYQLSAAEEKIINLKAGSADRAWNQLTAGRLAADTFETLGEDGKRSEQGEEGLLALCSSKDKAVRDEAAKHFNELLERNVIIAEAEINAILDNKKVDDGLRGYERPDSARHMGDDIETEIVDSMLDAVSARNDIANRYYELKAKLLGVDKLAYHERNVDYGELKGSFDFATACDLVYKVCERLDPEFCEGFETLLNNSQIDVYPKVGKRGGAMCAYGLITQPTYMMLNYTGKLKDVTTLAHELGHGLNDELMRKAQNSLSFSTPMATAEVASQFMEDFVLDELVKDASDEQKLAINMDRLNGDISSVFRQVACYRFEQKLHADFRAKGYLSAEQIGEIFLEAMKAYMGEAVEQSPGSQNWWVYWSHIRQFFYVYSYASGLIIAKAMQQKVRDDNNFVAKVKQFMAAGSSRSPKELFAEMALDITNPQFWNDGLDEIQKLLDETTALAQKLGKI